MVPLVRKCFRSPGTMQKMGNSCLGKAKKRKRENKGKSKFSDVQRRLFKVYVLRSYEGVFSFRSLVFFEI